MRRLRPGHAGNVAALGLALIWPYCARGTTGKCRAVARATPRRLPGHRLKIASKTAKPTP